MGVTTGFVIGSLSAIYACIDLEYMPKKHRWLKRSNKSKNNARSQSPSITAQPRGMVYDL